jgi:hypothetical protein
VVLFENGISIPSMEVEIQIDEVLSSKETAIICYSKENVDYRKYFILPANISASKLIFYIDTDQELKCEIIGSSYEIVATESFTVVTNNLVKLN